jgi:hypothetical protein
MVRRSALLCLFLLLLPPLAGRALAECPGAAQALAMLRAQPLDQAARSQRLGSEVPFDLFEKAVASPGTPITRRTGSRAQGVMLVELPIELLWQALNDDHHHAEGDYLPVRASEVVRGRPGHADRDLFQYYLKAGFGRWWVVRMGMNEALFDSSEGALWELSWQSVMDEYQQPPARMGASIQGIESSFGSWLLVRLGAECTLVEYVADGDVGGFGSSLQWMGLTRALRTTMRGMVAIATEHLAEPHPRGVFVRPDGVSMDTPVP